MPKWSGWWTPVRPTGIDDWQTSKTVVQGGAPDGHRSQDVAAPQVAEDYGVNQAQQGYGDIGDDCGPGYTAYLVV